MTSKDATSAAARNPDLVALVHASPDPIVVIQDGRHVFANERALAVHRAGSLAELASIPAIEHMAPSMRRVARTRMQSMTDELRQLDYVDEVIICLDGTRCEIEAAGSPIVFEGRPAALVVFRDITDRTQAERARHAAEERFRAAFVHAPIGMAVVDTAGAITEANPAMAMLLRCSVEDLVGSTAVDWVFPVDLAGSRERFARLLSDRSTVETAEVRVLRRDGELAWTHASTSTLRDPAGAPSSFILQLQDITERHLAEEQLTFRATRDHLTGLANRVLFTEFLHEALTAAAQDGIPPAVLFVDIDRFKNVNDSMGHGCGDELLAQVAHRLRASMRPSDLIARFGGDEFAVLLREVRDSDDAVLAARRLGDSLTEPFRIDRAEIYVNVSIGIALADSGSDVEGLLRDADSAMYRAKATGGSSHVVFDEKVRAVCSRRMDLESGLHRAAADGELSLVYQPIVETATGIRTGFEALLRWHRSNGEVVSPAEFIPIAEESGTIVPIGAWVLDEACRQARAWRAVNRSMPPLTIGVNVSTRQLLDPAFFDAAVSASQSIYPDVLALEITESAAAQICDPALATLHGLSRRGIRIALDDFGTGESSLARLRTLPVDTLKIDRQFIANISGSEEDESLVRAILAMADALGLTAVAEGVETQAQAALLRKAGCPFAQGYLFGRPLPADEIRLHAIAA